MQRQVLGQMHRTAIMCVDSYENGVPVGRFYHPSNEGMCAFRSLSQFLTELDRTLDETAFPQSFNAVRSFSEAETPLGILPTDAGSMEGALATFSIRILFRQNASWQGSVRWLETAREQSFRSALELIFLLDSVLSDAA